MQNISERLELSEKFLWHSYSLVRSGRGYTTFEIPKKSGESRVIHKPVDDLHYVQTLIKSRILDEAPPPPDCVTAFREGMSIRDNASVHCDKAVLVKFDLKDFFPSVSFSRVKGIFESLGFCGDDARGLAYLATIETDQVEDSPSSLVYFERLQKEGIASHSVENLRWVASILYGGIEDGIDHGDLHWQAKELSEAASNIKEAPTGQSGRQAPGCPPCGTGRIPRISIYALCRRFDVFSRRSARQDQCSGSVGWANCQ
jgi:hypothetical protein